MSLLKIINLIINLIQTERYNSKLYSLIMRKFKNPFILQDINKEVLMTRKLLSEGDYESGDDELLNSELSEDIDEFPVDLDDIDED